MSDEARIDAASSEAAMTSAVRPLASLEAVSFSYGDHVALDGVTLSVARGEAVALLGPNGCGKSTALRLLCGLDFASSGVVTFDGDVVDARSMGNQAFAKRLHQRMGLVFQDSDVQLFCPSVAEEVAFGPRQMGLSDDEASRRTADTLALFGIANLADRAPYQLSGGEKKKVALACVVSMAPDLLLLDEPTDGLDEESAAVTVAFLRSFVAAGKSVLVTTHHPDLVEAVGARVVRMDRLHHVASKSMRVQ